MPRHDEEHRVPRAPMQATSPDSRGTPDLRVERQLVSRITPILAPLDKRALGVAIGLALSLAIAGATLVSMVADPEGRFPLGLLSNFFVGYAVTPTGLFVGAAWGFVTGFVWGWFLAFTRNLVFAIWVLWVRVRADVAVSRDLLDHI